MSFREDLEGGKGWEELAARRLGKLFGEFTVVPSDTELPFDLYNDRYKVEVKADFYSKKSSNIAIEYMYNGKPSGISSTKADMWFHAFKNYDKWFYLCVSVTELKQYLKEKNYPRKRGGDNNYSQLILIPKENLTKDFKTSIHEINL